MDREQLLQLYDLEERRNAISHSSRREATDHIVRFLPLSGMKGGGYILYSRLDESNADAAIQGEIEYFGRLGAEFEWKLYDHDQPADLKERLAAQGLTIEEPEAFMVLDLAAAPEYLKQPVSLDVRKITDLALIPEILSVQKAVWADKDIAYVEEALQELRLDPEHTSYYAAYVGGKPVSSARITFGHGGHFAGLWSGATLPAYRRQGFYTALVAARAQEAIRRGYRFLTIDASPMSRPIVERHGFRFLVYTYPCTWTPQGSR